MDGKGKARRSAPKLSRWQRIASSARIVEAVHPRRETIEAVLPTREPTCTCCNGALVDAGHHPAPPASPRSAPGRRCPLATADAPPLDRLLDAVRTLAPLMRAYAEEAEQPECVFRPVWRSKRCCWRMQVWHVLFACIGAVCLTSSRGRQLHGSDLVIQVLLLPWTHNFSQDVDDRCGQPIA